MLFARTCTLSWAIFVLLELVEVLDGYSHPLSLCSLTRQDMIRGMGGGHQNLGYSLSIDGNTVKLQIPENGSLKGLFLYARDSSGSPVGTWESDTPGFQPISSTTCNGGAITHSNAEVKAASNTPTFKLTLPDGVKSATVQGFAVQAKTTWQELDPITVTSEAPKKVAGNKEASKSFCAKPSAYLVGLALLGLSSYFFA